MATAERRVVVELVQSGHVAVVRMRHGDNRFHPEFLRDFHNVLDEVEKYAMTVIAIC